ncbi:hypothetical protein MNBD_GAMMA11-739 [hydrothermal vent metagenome]|uniref:Uncharacterized protein n=1 Tax=hydrothermal vent metagenome TaxID=652676 RepID=A0A3B0XZK9_9ZZZZ
MNIILNILKYTLTGVFIFVCILMFYIINPFIELKKERSDNILKTLDIVYYNITGDASCAKLYTYEKNNINKLTKPVFLSLPESMVSPEDTKAAFHDNRFSLTGYEYVYVRENIITGSREIIPSFHFDVVSWEIYTPYTLWPDTITDTSIDVYRVSSRPIKYTLNSSNHDASLFSGRNYTDCRF